MTRLAIIGPGLLGGSLALSARRVGNFRVRLWARRQAAAEDLRRLDIAEHVSTSMEKVCADADIAIFCVPVGAMPALAAEAAKWLPKGALVTDVGSVKARIVSELSEIFSARCRFVGSHPMAGSEQTGVQAAREDLFDDAVCIVTPEQRSDPQAVLAVRGFWELMGCNVRMLAPDEHDEVVALVSHLPHLLAATLVNTVSSHHIRALAFSGPGFRDTTRVAAGAPAMWTEIMASNSEPLRKSAEAMIEKLRDFITLLALDGDHPDRESRLNEFLTEAKVHRDSLRQPRLL